MKLIETILLDDRSVIYEYEAPSTAEIAELRALVKSAEMKVLGTIHISQFAISSWGMRTSEAIKHFGSRRALAEALGLKPPSVHRWGKTVPPLRQLQLERITNGALKASPEIVVPLARAPSEHAA